MPNAFLKAEKKNEKAIIIFVNSPHSVYSQAHKTIAPQRLVNVYVKTMIHAVSVDVLG